MAKSLGSRVRRQALNPSPATYQLSGFRQVLILFCLFPPCKERMIKAPTTSGLWWWLNEVIYAQCSEQCLAHECCASICYSCFVDRALDLNTVRLWTWGYFFVGSVLGAHWFLLQDSGSCKIHPLTSSLLLFRFVPYTWTLLFGHVLYSDPQKKSQ